MDITATVTLNEAEERALLRQLQQARLSEPSLTADILAERLLKKLFQKWADDAREQFIQRNRPMMEQLIADLALDPDRDAKLAPLGVTFVNGELQPL